MTVIEELENTYGKVEKSFTKRTDSLDRAYSKSLTRNVLNSLKLRNHPFLERQYIYPANAENSINPELDFVHYDYMHIRLKPQSTKYKRVSATANSVPRYLPVVIHSDNTMVIYDTTVRMQGYMKNRPVFLRLNLTEEGISTSPHEILSLIVAQTPANSYKKDNQDLKPDDRPFFSLVLRDGRHYYFMLNVIDKTSALSHFRRNHPDDTRYIFPN